MARLLILIAVWLFSGAFACSSQPVATASSHPPAADLTCLPEPSALTDEQVIADIDGSVEQQFNINQIVAGRSCRDALHRVCAWHKERGDKDVDCDKPPQ